MGVGGRVSLFYLTSQRLREGTDWPAPTAAAFAGRSQGDTLPPLPARRGWEDRSACRRSSPSPKRRPEPPPYHVSRPQPSETHECGWSRCGLKTQNQQMERKKNPKPNWKEHPVLYVAYSTFGLSILLVLAVGAEIRGSCPSTPPTLLHPSQQEEGTAGIPCPSGLTWPILLEGGCIKQVWRWIKNPWAICQRLAENPQSSDVRMSVPNKQAACASCWCSLCFPDADRLLHPNSPHPIMRSLTNDKLHHAETSANYCWSVNL